MIVISAMIFGALLGTLVAKRRNGKRLDMLQYAASFAILFAIIGLFGTVFIDRMVR